MSLRHVGILLVLFLLLAACSPASPATPQAKEPVATAGEQVASASPLPTAVVTMPAPAVVTIEPTAAPPMPTSTPEQLDEGQLTVVGVLAGDVLNVRAEPNANSAIVGTLPPGTQGVQPTGRGTEVEGYLWLPVTLDAVSGWVNSYFLAEQVGAADAAAVARAETLIAALAEGDMAALSEAAHPDKGVRFSPYGYIRPDDDVMFSGAELAGKADDPRVYHWGAFDGSGQPIDMTFADYFQRFVMDVDFSHPQVVGFDSVVGSGNTINNMAEVYPGATVVEYHFREVDPQYQGMDWRSLRLVFEQKGGEWYLVGIVHDEWTI